MSQKRTTLTQKRKIIEERSSEIRTQLTFGNLEADLVKKVRKTSEPALLTLTECKNLRSLTSMLQLP